MTGWGGGAELEDNCAFVQFNEDQFGVEIALRGCDAGGAQDRAGGCALDGKLRDFSHQRAWIGGRALRRIGIHTDPFFAITAEQIERVQAAVAASGERYD